MSSRNWLNNNSATVTILAVVLLIFSLAFIVYTNKGPSPVTGPDKMYYYDLDTKELFADSPMKNPPIETPSGKANRGARAFVYSCGSCSDEASRFIGYLEMNTPAAKRALDGPPITDPEDPNFDVDFYEVGRMIRRPTDGDNQWVKGNEEAGVAIVNEIDTKCDGNPPKVCLPRDE